MFNLVKWRFTFPIFLMISILFPYFRSFTMLFSQNDTYTFGSQVILDDEDHGWTVISYAEKETEIEWTIEYQKFLDTSTDDEVERLMKLKIDFSDNNDVTLLEESGLIEKNGWYQEEDYSPQSEGRLVLTTPKEQTEMTIELQMDELRTTEVISEAITNNEQSTEQSTEHLDTEEKEIKNVLPAELAGPHTITAEVSEIVQKETTETMETTQTTTEDPQQESDIPKTKAQQTTDAKRSEDPVPNDPFSYITGENVFKHPEHYTNEYLTGPTTNSTNDDIRNYDYGATDSQTGIPPVEPAYNELNFNTGYHDYGDGLLKKTVIPTDDPTKFKIQLDMIGNAVQKDKKMDVVLVLDKSSSMAEQQTGGETRWGVLHGALSGSDGFVQGLLDAGDVRIGLASFNTPFGPGIPARPQAEIGNFGDENNFYGFSQDRNAILNHSICRTAPLPSTNPRPSGGTPTFLGFDAGYELLTNPAYGVRPDAEKILIVLTDGMPTYCPSRAYEALADGNSSPITRAVPNPTNSGDVRIFRLEEALKYYAGNGSPLGTTITSTINYLGIRTSSNPTIRYYSIGFYVGRNNNEGSVAHLVDDVLLALGPDGPTTPYNAQTDDELIKKLKDLLVSVFKTIDNAILTDPMSEYVTRISPVTSTALALTEDGITTISPGASNYPAYAKEIDKSLPEDLDPDNRDNPIRLTNINLGRNNGIREGYRIEYEVELKEEYHNGKFYPTNDATHLKNGDNYLHFAVPSVRYQEPLQEFAIDVKKIWQDDENKWKRQEDIILKLQKKIGEGQWEDVPGKTVTIPTESTGENLETCFTGIPGYDENDDLIVYRIVEIIASGQDPPIDGYLPPVYSPEEFTIEDVEAVIEGEETVNKVDVTVTNTMPFTDFEFTKVDHSGERPLKDAKFTLYTGQGEEAELVTHFEEITSGIDGKVIFPRLPAGKYTIKESEVPPGYGPRADIEFEIALDPDTGEAYVKETNLNGTTDLKARNELYPFKIKLIKTDDGDTPVPLAGAKFLLTGSNLENPVSVISGEDGLLTFAGLAPGTYILTETEPPRGHQVAAGSPWNIIIKDNGTVEITDASGMPVDINISYATEDNEQVENMIDEWYIINPKIPDYQLIIEKEDNFGNPLAGAYFRLENEDEAYDEVAPDENSPSALIQFTELKPGRYILTEIQVPNDHIGLKNPIVIVINNDGTVEIDGLSHEVETDGNIIRLTIKNRKKGVLPFTGGALHTASLLASATVFLLAIGISIYYGYRNRKGAK